MLVRRILKWSMWMVAGCLALVVLLYLYVLFVNRHDQPPSKAVVRFEALLRDLPPVADKDNGYVYYMGISAPQNVDPHYAGMVRIAWAKQWMAYSEQPAGKFPGKMMDVDGGRSVAVKDLAATCKDIGADCARALEASGPVIAQWLASEKVLTERYDTLLTYPQWRETLPYDDRLPPAPFVSILEGQKVHLLATWERAGQGDAAGVKALLESDMRFWRRNLAANDTLIAKMISCAAIRRNFAWGNLILRRLPADKAAGAIPGAWRDPVSDQERSLLRALAGEWRFSATALKKMNEGKMRGAASDGVMVRAFTESLAKTAFQFQDTSNLHADLMASTADAYAASYGKIPAAMQGNRARTRTLLEELTATRGYNVLGNILFRVGSPDMTRYALRLSDLEGIRRATLLMADLRSRGLGAADMEQQLTAAHVGSPYDDKPFGWDSQARAIVFTGLEDGKWGRTSIPY